MNIVTPNYYSAFRCMADKCRHSCCVGWEIDIDAETLARYRAVPGAFGKRLAAHIADGQFVLDAQERCPFLNADGLCDIITELGEDALCQICADHPRFRHFYTDRVELGLGLCCEEAARLLLTHPAPMVLISNTDDEETTDEEYRFFVFRQQWFNRLISESKPLDERLDDLLAAVSVDLSRTDWYAVYVSLERLDDRWADRLTALRGGLVPIPAAWEEKFARLAMYFFYRHLTDGWRSDRLAESAALAVLSTRVIAAIFAADEPSLEELIEIARAYSAEVEYSAENLDRLLSECAIFSN